MVQSIVFNNKSYFSNQFIVQDYNDCDDFTGNEIIVENRFNDQLCSVIIRNHNNNDMLITVDNQIVTIRPGVGVKFYKQNNDSELTFLVDSFMI